VRSIVEMKNGGGEIRPPFSVKATASQQKSSVLRYFADNVIIALCFQEKNQIKINIEEDGDFFLAFFLCSFL
jgi:hypothetical protein